MKAQVDHLPLSYKGLRPTQGRTLAVMQVSAGSQSFNSVNTLRILGRWMRMITIPNQSSVAKAYAEFDEGGRMLARSEEHTSELQSIMRISYAVFCLKTKKRTRSHTTNTRT